MNSRHADANKMSSDSVLIHNKQFHEHFDFSNDMAAVKVFLPSSVHYSPRHAALNFTLRTRVSRTKSVINVMYCIMQ
ncbi:hypothetical protein E2C01_062749 [Portunus trituberculatus]|uniref:Uncharacterized protein n=1 Tax=Portunus trituberculatus TaxID=210409 RepID=A0A5B7HGX4_PORTR|nr:hypothetical protein [Portunus trituberculatus]